MHLSHHGGIGKIGLDDWLDDASFLCVELCVDIGHLVKFEGVGVDDGGVELVFEYELEDVLFRGIR